MIPPGLRVLAVTSMYPTPDDPGYGAFVAAQMDSVVRCGAQVRLEFIDGRRGKRRYVTGARRVRRLAASGRFDVVHAHYGLTGFMASFHSHPLVVSFCGDDLLGTPNGRGGITWKSRLDRWCSRRAARRADGIICKSAEIRSALPAREDRSRAHVIPNGVDTDRFSPGDRAAARRRLGLDVGDRLVLFPHTPGVARKRFDLAEAATALLSARGVGARLWVIHAIPQAAMADHYRAADCLLLTSDQEGSPNVVKEALCCDLPVVTVDAGDVRRWVEVAPGSRIVARNPTSIAAGLEAVLSGAGRVDGRRVREELSAERVARRVLGVYAEAMGRAARQSAT